MTLARERAAPHRGRVRETVDFLLWAYTPFRPLNATGIYDLVSTNAFTAQGLYLNLGYWKNARTIDQACEAMVSLVAETARWVQVTTSSMLASGSPNRTFYGLSALRPAISPG